MRIVRPAQLFYFDDVHPTDRALVRYIQVSGAVSGDALTTAGIHALDVWACARARCQEWNVSVSGSISGEGYSGTFSPTLLNPIAPLTAYPGYTDHPEVATINNEFITSASGTADNVGSWSYVDPDPAFNDSGDFTIGTSLSFRAQDAEVIVSGGVIPAYAGPLVVGTTMYLPFLINCGVVMNGAGPAAFAFNITSQHRPIPSYITCGSLTVNVFNWRTGGTASLSMPLFAQGLLDGMSATCNITIAPTSGSYYSYGNQPDNSNPRWAADGSVIGEPGTP